MSDLLLWKSMKGGNRSSLEKIYREHFPYLYNYCRKMIRDDELIADCIQDLFIELWTKRENLGDTDSIRKYLTVVVRRKLVKMIRQEQKTTAPENMENFIFDVHFSIEKQMIESEERSSLHQKLLSALEKLSDRQKEIIFLKYYNGYTNQEIAEVLNINYQSVRNLVSRTLKILSGSMKFFIIF